MVSLSEPSCNSHISPTVQLFEHFGTGRMEPRYATIKLLLINICLLILQSNAETEAVHDINILLVVSFGQFGYNSSGVIPAADIALEDINKDPDILPGYKLTYDRVRDSQVSQYEH